MRVKTQIATIRSGSIPIQRHCIKGLWPDMTNSCGCWSNEVQDSICKIPSGKEHPRVGRRTQATRSWRRIFVCNKMQSHGTFECSSSTRIKKQDRSVAIHPFQDAVAGAAYGRGGWTGSRNMHEQLLSSNQQQDCFTKLQEVSMADLPAFNHHLLLLATQTFWALGELDP